jgi:hypothetical protein
LSNSSTLLNRKADPPFIAIRNRRADQYIPRLQRGIQKLFNDATTEAARHAQYDDRNIYFSEMIVALAEALYAFQKPYVIGIINEGYALADQAFTTKNFHSGVQRKIINITPEPLSGSREGIEEWLLETSKREAATHAKEINRIHKKAQTYWDEDFGRGMTPREIASEILAKGFAYNKNYSNLISRTTTIWSMNEGAEIKYIEAGVTRERWLTTDDDVRCVYCMEMNGTEIGIKDVFLQEGGRIVHPEIPDRFLEVPFAVSHPPLHPYCRCCVVPVIESISIQMRG